MYALKLITTHDDIERILLGEKATDERPYDLEMRGETHGYDTFDIEYWRRDDYFPAIIVECTKYEIHGCGCPRCATHPTIVFYLGGLVKCNLVPDFERAYRKIPRVHREPPLIRMVQILVPAKKKPKARTTLEMLVNAGLAGSERRVRIHPKPAAGSEEGG